MAAPQRESQIIRVHALSQFPQRLVEAVRRFAAHPQAMGKVLGIVYRAISTHLIYKAGLQIRDGATGTVTPARPMFWLNSPATSRPVMP